MRWCARCSMRRAATAPCARRSPRLPAEADAALVTPLLEFRNFGVPLPHNWTTVINSAEFGTDFYTRTAIAKSNIFINRPRETRYFYQDLDSGGERLTGASRYTVTFDALPPVDAKGFWSITLYNQHHFFAPNEIDRYLARHQEQGVALRGRRLARHPRAEGPARRRQGRQLAAGAGRRLLALHPGLLAARCRFNEGSWTPPPVVPV